MVIPEYQGKKIGIGIMNKLIEKIKKNNYKLEKEIIDNENSIILTLNID